MFAPALQDLQNMRDVANLLRPAARDNACRQNAQLRRVRGRQRRRVYGAPRGYQTPTARGEGRVQQDFQGTQALTQPTR